MKRNLIPALAAALLAAPAVSFAADSAASGFAHDAIANHSPHGQLLIVSGNVDAVGDGTTTLSLWIGQSAAARTCVETRTVTATGPQTFRYVNTGRALGGWDYWWVKLEQTVGDATTETWLPQSGTVNNWVYFEDGSFYEWTGGASGVWSDVANWTQTAEVDYGGAKTDYPANPTFGGGILPAGGTYDITFTSAVNPDELRIGDGANLTLRGANRAPAVAFDKIYRGATSGNINYSGLASFVVDGLDLWWTPTVGVVANNAVFVVTNGGRWIVSGELYPQGSGATFRFAPGSALESGGFFCGSANGFVEIDDATITMTGEGWYPAYNAGTGGKTVLKGAAPAIICTSANAKVGGGAGADATLEFVVPAGGWASPPVRGPANGNHAFGTAYRDAGNLILNIASNSPAAAAAGVTDTVLVSWPAGFNADRLVYGTLPNPTTDEFYTALNPDTNVPELHVRIFGQAQGVADPTITAVSAAVQSRTEATFSAAVMLGGSAASATATLLLSVNGGAETAATNATLAASGSLVLPLAGLPASATCTARLRVENSDGRVATSDPVSFRLLAAYAEIEVSGEGVTLARAGTDTVAEFTADGTFTVLRGGEAEVLVVAGGGSGGTAGGGWAAGGGGAGGVLHITNLWLDAGDYTVLVGASGLASNNRGTLGENGGDSSFWSYRATGGGAGCCDSVKLGAASGGSGGGGVGNSGYRAAAGIAGQGNAGGDGNGAWIPGGGGGAGSAGAAGATGLAGAGGAGLSFTIGKKTYEVAGGGGAGALSSTEPGSATHGGGAGGAYGSAGSAGAAGTGGGGGGGGNAGGGAGGSGIVVVRMKTGLDGLLVIFR